MPSNSLAHAQLIFIPGLAGDATMWRSQISAFPASLRAQVATSHQNADALTIEDMARLLLAEHPGPLLLCGASMGGMVAMEVARQAPQRVAGLMLLGTTARPESPEMEEQRSAAIVQFEQGNAHEVITENAAVAFHPRNAQRPELVAEYLDFVLGAGTAQLIRQNRAVMARPDAREHLPNLTCPALIVFGDEDRIAPADVAGEMASLIPRSELVEIADCGHMLTMEQPQKLNQILLEWLTRHGWGRD